VPSGFVLKIVPNPSVPPLEVTPQSAGVWALLLKAIRKNSQHKREGLSQVECNRVFIGN
jgi:hypothetical protein